MWYVLAAANALSGDADLIAGTQLKVPEMAASKNDATSFRPYNPGEIVGSTAPGLPYIPPAASNGCNTIIQIVMVVVAVVISFYAPVLAPTLAGAIGTSVVVAEAIIVGAVTFAAHATTTAIGSALGLTTFSWRNSVREGVIAGVTYGLAKTNLGKIGELMFKSRYAQVAAQAVINASVNKAVDIGASKIAGLPSSFSWKSIAIDAAVSAAVAPKANEFGNNMAAGIKNDRVRAFTGNMIGGIVTNTIRVGVSRAMGVQARFSWGQIAGNAFAAATASDFQTMINASINEGMAANDGDADTAVQDVNNPIGALPGLTATVQTSRSDPINAALVAPASKVAAGYSRLDKIAILNNFYSNDSDKLSRFSRRSVVDEAWDMAKSELFGLQSRDAIKTLDRVEVSASGYTGTAGNYLSRGIGYGVFRLETIRAFQSRGGTPHLAIPSQRNTGNPGGMSADQYRRDSNRQLWSDVKGIFTPIPALANIKQGLQDFAVDVGTSNIPLAYATGALISVGAEILPQSPVDVALTLLGGAASANAIERTTSKQIQNIEELKPAHFRTASNEAVFYAGRGNLNRFAAENSSGKTISQTQGGGGFRQIGRLVINVH